MRVISGRAKGRRLASPKSNKIRPALDQVKESIFNILFDVRDLCVLDLFAGSGSIGIEAISRGAASVTFVDNFTSAIHTIKKNLTLCDFSDRAYIMKLDAKKAIKKLGRLGLKFDIIFVDPPYLRNLVNPTLDALANGKLLTPATIIIVEHHPKEVIKPPEGLMLTDCRHFGQTHVSFLKPAP